MFSGQQITQTKQGKFTTTPIMNVNNTILQIKHSVIGVLVWSSLMHNFPNQM